MGSCRQDEVLLTMETQKNASDTRRLLMNN